MRAMRPRRPKPRRYRKYDYEFRDYPVYDLDAEALDLLRRLRPNAITPSDYITLDLFFEAIVSVNQVVAGTVSHYADSDSFGDAAVTPGAASVTPSLYDESADTFTASTVAVSGDPHIGNVVLLVHFDGADAAAAATDIKGHALTFAGNAQLDTAEKKFGTASLLLDGTGDYVSTPDSADWRLPGELTIEAWVRPNPGSNKTMYIVNHGAGTNPNLDWGLRYVKSSATSKKFAFVFFPTGSNTLTITAEMVDENINESVWHHVAGVRDSSNQFRIYLNGVNKTIGTPTNSGSVDATGDLNIGAFVVGLLQSWEGWIDEVRITKGVCRYTGNFTPPTMAFSDT